MRYRRLGRSGLQVSELSFGSWLTFGKLITEETAEALCRGLRHCADRRRSEAGMAHLAVRYTHGGLCQPNYLARGTQPSDPFSG